MRGHPDPDAAEGEAEPQAAGGGQASAFAQMVVGGMTGAILLFTGGLAFLEVTDGSRGEQQAVAVLGATETSTTAPPVTVTTQDTAAAWAALLAAAPTTTSSTTTTTTPPQTTTTTARPAPIVKASAAAAGTGVTLELDVVPSASGQIRALDARLLARFDDARVLRSLLVDFGDGAVLPADVQAWECNAPEAPDLFDLSLPGHTYRRPGTYVVTATATTATCSPDDDDWGPETSSQVEVTVVAN